MSLGKDMYSSLHQTLSSKYISCTPNPPHHPCFISAVVLVQKIGTIPQPCRTRRTLLALFLEPLCYSLACLALNYPLMCVSVSWLSSDPFNLSRSFWTSSLQPLVLPVQVLSELRDRTLLHSCLWRISFRASLGTACLLCVCVCVWDRQVLLAL